MVRLMGVLLLPFLGTVLGSSGVYFPWIIRRYNAERLLSGFAAGVMVAASVWSLILPALELSAELGIWQFIPALAGVWGGFAFLLSLDHLIPHLHRWAEQPEGIHSKLGKQTMLLLAVTLHNLPEGMAVGVAAAGWLFSAESVSFSSLLSLSLGIALQNIPEGAIISLPLKSGGMERSRCFWWGVISGAVEPVGAVITLLFAWLVVPVLPYLLCFAAGAMLYVVVESLIPDSMSGNHSDLGVLAFCLGFSVMMTLDVALG